MKILVVGTGSIGTRHIKNLHKLGHEVCAVDINAENLKNVSSLTKDNYTSLEKALKNKPDAAFICTYSNDHIIPAMKCAEVGCHLFIEKPLSLTLDETDDLIRIVKEKNIITLVGCNMRFHPAISYIYKAMADNPGYGRPLHAYLEFGYYLPFDKKDYESSYKAKKSLGGNLIFDGIHELDYACWFFGEPERVLSSKGILSDLKIDTEDHVDMMIKFRSGVACTVHMDYLQHSYTRRCKVICENATICWDFTDGRIGTVTAEDGQWSWQDMKLEISYNEMYMDEAVYFLDSVVKGTQTFNSVGQSLHALKLAISANRSCETDRWEQV